MIVDKKLHNRIVVKLKWKDKMWEDVETDELWWELRLWIRRN